MEGSKTQGTKRRRGSFRARVAIVFSLQTLVVVIASLMAAKNVAPIGAAIAIMLSSAGLAMTSAPNGSIANPRLWMISLARSASSFFT